MEWLVVLAIVVGVVGIFVPVLPGLLLVAAGVGLWSVANEVWWLLALTLVLTFVAIALKVAIPARAARDAASTTALAVGAVAALVGFFAIPVVGMIAGFLGGVLATEIVRLKDVRAAWAATWTTTKSIGITMGIELIAAILMAAAWVGAWVGTLTAG